jgi:hypothetical protein
LRPRIVASPDTKSFRWRLPTVRAGERAGVEFYRRTDFTETGAIHGGEIVMERQL